jgi:hypothetical protein
MWMVISFPANWNNNATAAQIRESESDIGATAEMRQSQAAL